MDSSNRELKTYIRSIKRNLSCSFNMKAVLINEFNDRLSDYLDENPDSTMADVISYFGAPEEIAKSFDVNNDYYKEKAKKMLKLEIILFIALLAVIAISAVVITLIVKLNATHIVVH